MLLLNAVERHVEYQRGVRRNPRIRRGAVAVSEVGWKDEAALTADTHADDALIPASNHCAYAQLEREAGIGLELRALGVGPARIVKPSCVGDSYSTPGLGDRSCADDEIGLRIRRAGSWWDCGCCGFAVAAAGGDEEQSDERYQTFHYSQFRRRTLTRGLAYFFCPCGR